MATQILVVDDNPDNLKLMTYLLKASGYMPLTAIDGQEALDLLETQRPDMIVCDIQLPRVDGFEVAQRLKSDSRLPDIPLVAVTALAMVGDRERMLAAGFDGYISKPIVPQTFVQQVEAFLPEEARRSPPEPHNHSAKPQNTPVARPSRATILVVDDSHVNITLIRSILQPFGYRIVAAQGVREGLSLARECRPDLIISDIHMPGQDGPDFINALKVDPQLCKIPFMFLSSTESPSKNGQEMLAIGADQYLKRPLHPKVLLAEIEACLQGQKVE